MQAVCSFEISVAICKATWCHHPTDNNLNLHCHRSHVIHYLFIQQLFIGAHVKIIHSFLHVCNPPPPKALHMTYIMCGISDCSYEMFCLWQDCDYIWCLQQKYNWCNQKSLDNTTVIYSTLMKCDILNARWKLWRRLDSLRNCCYCCHSKFLPHWVNCKLTSEVGTPWSKQRNKKSISAMLKFQFMRP